ncbi:hypothetical protein AMR42_12540 [Limnothrix sp. PR1529]|nr:hypothetical protein BCR12_14760 [Limnothrix sp. P13C2]PIB09763.1 hypothetical protein AMR42_12540 [Limnothrix sp. PR1529]
MSYWLRWLRGVCWMAMHDEDFCHRCLALAISPVQWSGRVSEDSRGEKELIWWIEGYLIICWPQLWIRPLDELPTDPADSAPIADYDEMPF